jgi:hypothetical protein
MSTTAAASWDAEYAAGRYQDEPPVSFAFDVIDAARSANLRRGLYVGCGNGRNLIPMSDAGLDLIGLDISAQAIAQLHRRRPDAATLIAGDLGARRPAVHPGQRHHHRHPSRSPADRGRRRRQLYHPLPQRPQNRARHSLLHRRGTGKLHRRRIQPGPAPPAGPHAMGSSRRRPVVPMGSNLAATQASVTLPPRRDPECASGRPECLRTSGNRSSGSFERGGQLAGRMHGQRYERAADLEHESLPDEPVQFGMVGAADRGAGAGRGVQRLHG